MSGMKDYTPYVYAQPIRQEPKLYFGEFEAEFKGFKYRKEEQFNLYYIVCPENRLLPYDLQGRFSKIKMLEEAIDNWLSVYTMEELPFVPKPPRKHVKTIQEESTIEQL
jgi:hypothetical protein